MLITHDYSYTNKNLIDNGYAVYGIHSFNFDRYFTEEEMEQNKQFAEQYGDMSHEWANSCDRLGQEICKQMENMMEDTPGNPSKKPDLLIYIHVSLDTMLERIKKRGRSFEQLSTDPGLKDYYARLLSYYEPWYEHYNASPKMEINGDNLDFVIDEDAKKEVLSEIDNKLREIGNL